MPLPIVPVGKYDCLVIHFHLNPFVGYRQYTNTENNLDEISTIILSPLNVDL